MEPDQQRVIDERAELAERGRKLRAFMEGDVFSALPMAEQLRMRRQRLLMKLLHEVLTERIEEFPK